MFKSCISPVLRFRDPDSNPELVGCIFSFPNYKHLITLQSKYVLFVDNTCRYICHNEGLILKHWCVICLDMYAVHVSPP